MRKTVEKKDGNDNTTVNLSSQSTQTKVITVNGTPNPLYLSQAEHQPNVVPRLRPPSPSPENRLPTCGVSFVENYDVMQ